MANRTYNALSPRNAYQEHQSQPPVVDWSDFPQEAQGGIDWSDFPEEEDNRLPDFTNDLVLPEKEKTPYAPTYENVPWLKPTDPFKPKSYDAFGTNLANEVPEEPSLSKSMYGDSSFNYDKQPQFGVKPFEGIQSTNPDDYETSDPEFSLRDLFTMENAIRSSGPILGGIIGGAVGGGTGLLGGPAAPGTVPLGAKVGQSIGSAAGTFVTDPIANWYAGKPQDWGSTTFEAGVNAAVGPFGRGLQGTSARKILANAVEQATIGGAEGLINAPARKMIRDRAIWDKTGNLNLPNANEWIGAGTTGMTVGGGFGLAHGLGARGYQAYRAARNPLFTGDIPGGAKTVDPNYVPPSGPRPSAPDFDDTATYTYNGPESNQLPPGPKGADPVITFDHPDMASIQHWRDQGYVMVDRDAKGRFRMARADVADQYIAPVPETAPAENAFVFNAPKSDVGVIKLSPTDLNENTLTQLKQAGYEMVGHHQDGSTSWAKPAISGDPNLNQGQGDAEQAGSTPYGEAPQRNVLEGEILPATEGPGSPGWKDDITSSTGEIENFLNSQGPIVGETRTAESALDRRIKQFAHLQGNVRLVNQLEDFLGRPPTDADLNASGPFVAADPRSEFFQKRQEMMDQTAQMEQERQNRPFNQEEADKRETWERQNHNLAVYEGRTDPVIKASYDKMQAVKDAYSTWFHQQENQLPEGEYFKPPPEIEEAYKAQIEQMEDAHEAVINSRGGYKQGRPADIQGEVVPPTSQVGPTIQLPPGFTPPPPQDPFIQDLKARMKYLDGRKAPDASYKALASKISDAPLKGRETWRSRLAKGIREAEKGPGKIEKGGPGSADVNNQYLQLRQMLGREPTEADYIAAGMRTPGPGEETGRVAQFPEPLGQMAHRLVQEEAANPAKYFALDSTGEFAERVGKITSTDELDKLTLELRAGIENARQSGMSPESRIAYYDLMGILNARRVVLSKAGVSQLDKTLAGFSQPGGNINVRAPGKDGNVEWPPKSGNVQQPTYQPTEVYEQPGLPFGPTRANPNPPSMGIGDMRAQNGVQNISSDPNQLSLPLTTDYNHPKPGGPGSADINKAFLEFIQREGREPTDDELVNITWGAEKSLNMAPVGPTGMMASPELDFSQYGPKAQEYLQWAQSTKNLRPLDSVEQRIEFDHFLKSLDWEEDPNKMPAVRPEDVNNAVRDTTMSDAQVQSWTGPLSPNEEKNVGRTEYLPDVPIPPMARMEAAITDVRELDLPEDLPITDATKVIIRSAMDRINDGKTVNEVLMMQNSFDDDNDLAVEQNNRDHAEIYSALAHYAAQRTVKMSREAITKLQLEPEILADIDNDQAVIIRSAMDKIDASATPEEADQHIKDMHKMQEDIARTHPRLSRVANALANYGIYKWRQLESDYAGANTEFTPRVSIAKSGEQQDLPEFGLQEKKPFDVAKAIEQWEDAQETPGFYKVPSKKIIDTETGMTERDIVDQRNIIRNMQMDAAHGITEGDFTPKFLEHFPKLKGQFRRIVGWNAGAVDVELKNGQIVITGRDDVTATIPSKRSWTSHAVMNPTRFDRNGKFIGSASKDVDWSDFPDQEPLPLSTDLSVPPELEGKKYGPGAAVPGDISGRTNDEIWMDMLDELGRPPTHEEYLAFLRDGPKRTPPRNLAEREARRKEVIQKITNTFEEANGYGATDFILPNGKLLAHGDITHNKGASRAGTSLSEVLNSGVVRFASNSAETNGPITGMQALHIAKAGQEHRHERAYVDINLPGGDIVARTFVDRTLNSKAIQTWVNSHFPNESMREGEQQILPGIPQGHIPPADLDNPKVEIFEGAGPGQLKFDFTNPAVARFRDNLPATKIPREARFLTVDGEMLGFPRGLNTHDDTAHHFGTTVDEVLQSGMIRVRGGTAEIQRPITMQQARQLVDMDKSNKNYGVTIEITKPGTYGQSVKHKAFSDRATASTIYNWVRTMFQAFEEGWNEKGDGGTSTGAIFGGMPFGRAARGVRNAARRAGWGQGGVNPASRVSPQPQQAPQPYSKLDEALQVPRHAMTAGDVSFLKRQAAGMITRPEYWKAVMEIPMTMRQAGFDQIDQRNRASIIYQHPVGAPTRAHPQGQPLPSLADDMGIQLYSLASAQQQIGPRAQAVASRWLEELPGPVGKMYRVSSRMHTAFLNTLKTNVAENMARNLVAMSGNAIQKITQQGGGTTTIRPGLKKQQVTAQEAFELNPFANPVFAREIGDWINTATGSGPLKTHIVWHKDYESNLENYANVLNRTMFASGLSASHVRMLNPGTYVMASPFVRKQYMRSALGQAAAWFTSMLVNKLGADALGIDNEISFNVTSSDFGKNRMGNVRLDPGQGLLQFLVLYGRHWYGGHTTASSDEFKRFGEEYRGDTHGFNFFRFMNNKTEPILKFATDLATADKNNPFHVGDRLAQLAIPLFFQDVMEIAKEEPWLLVPFGIQAAIGDGTQIYERNESRAKIIPAKYDYVYEGNEGLQKIMPWNWGEKDPNQLPEPYKGKWR